MIELFVGYFWPNFTLFLLTLVVMALAIALFVTGQAGLGIAALVVAGLLGFWFVRSTGRRYPIQ